MNELSLFSGAGGGLLGSSLLGWRTVGVVEIEKYPCKVLEARQRDGCLDDFPIWHMDIREFNRRVAPCYLGLVDVISAGFPCQPFSVAGKQRGADDERNMWPVTIECIRIVKPRFAFLENVPGLLSKRHGYFGRILRDLAESGYDARWRVLSAAEVGAPHLRKRLWIIADSASLRRGGRATEVGRQEGILSAGSWCGDNVANIKGAIRKGNRSESSGKSRESTDEGWWTTEPSVGRVAHGVARRVDRLKAIGNGQVPSVAAEAWQLLRNG